MVDWPVGYARKILQSTDSTLNEARRSLRYMTTPTWILAHQQTKARGRRGRSWQSPKGNFAATLALRPNGTPDQFALRSFVAALALRDTLSEVTGRAQGLRLKWPNDVLLNGGKVAGILLESGGPLGEVSHLFVGIGVNLAEAPPQSALEKGALRAVSLLSETGASIAPEEFLTFLAAAYARYETQFTTYGFDPIRTEWLRDAAKLGEVITARTSTSETTGTFEGVDKDGQLVLETAKGRRVIRAADVFF